MRPLRGLGELSQSLGLSILQHHRVSGQLLSLLSPIGHSGATLLNTVGSDHCDHTCLIERLVLTLEPEGSGLWGSDNPD